MNKLLIFTIYYLVTHSSLVFVSSRESLSCRNEEGLAVDWFVVYKIPYLQQDPSSTLKSGFAYAFISGPPIGRSNQGRNQQGWTLSTKLITSTNSIFAQTLNPIFEDSNSYTHLMYSDAPSNLGKWLPQTNVILLLSFCFV